jgi:hypothetical protein
MSFHDWTGFPRTVISVAVAMAALPVLAQNTTSAISGRVVGADGRAVAGATVTIVHRESGTVATTATDADGRYAARGLRVGGPYTVTITQGATSEKRENVFLTLAESFNLDVQIGGSVVVVTGRADPSGRFDSTNMGAGVNVSSAELAAFASIGRNLQDYARLDPRVSQTDKERGEISAAGQNSRYNVVSIDGVSVSDTFGLESNNLPTAKQPVPLDAIQTVQVNVANYDVTQKGYTGAYVNAVTKSGTNEFKGSVYHVFRNEGMVGDRLANNSRNRSNTDLSVVAKFEDSITGFTLGGPIVKDKLFFFGAYEELKSSRTSPDFGPLGSSLTNVGITPAAISAIQTIGKNTWGMDLGVPEVPTGTNQTVKDLMLRLDWSISDSQRAMLRYTKTEQAEPIFSNFGTRALSLSSHWYSQEKTLETLVGQWFADWTPQFSTELKLSHRDYESAPANNSTLPAIAFDFGGIDPSNTRSTTERTLWVGTERSRHYNQLATKTMDAYVGATWTPGAHEIKFGFDLARNKVFNAFLQDANGQYKFQCDDAFTYTSTTLTGGRCATATAAEWEAAALENFRLGRATSYQAQLPLAGRVLDDAVARWKLGNTGLFLQDTFKVSSRLSVMAGVRVDSTDMPQRPIANPKVAEAVIAGDPATSKRQTGGFGYDNSFMPDGNRLVQPRLGFNWNLGTKERRMQLRGGLGLFEGAAANVWLSNPYSNTGMAVAFFGCGSSAELTGGSANRAACSTSGVFRADPRAQQALGTNPAPSVDVLDTDLSQPAVWKFNLALDAELPWWGLVAGAEVLHLKTKQGIHYQHLNLGPATRTGSDGRQLFYNANGYNPNCWTAAGVVSSTAPGCGGSVSNRSLSNASFGNVILASGTSLGGSDTLTLSLSQEPIPGLRWSAAYSRAAAKEVSPLTSSVASSNFNARSIFNPNEEVEANSAYLVRDRVGASASWSRALWGRYKTTVGVYYEGRRGKPYSWTFNNDMNGDGQAGNDLMYIPSGPGSGEVVFAGGAAEEARFWAYVAMFPELSGARGKVVQRNGSFSPWVNNFDLRFSQEVPGFSSKHKGVFSLDILNVGNLINSKWGRIEEIGFQSAGGQARSFVNYKGIDASGKYVYSMMTTPEELITRQTRGESQWALQVTLRYEF